MKRYIILINLLLIASLALFHACNHSQATHDKHTLNLQSPIPEFLERNAALGSNKERQKTLTIYSDLKNKLTQNPEDIKSRTQLIQLFMLEARTTGEHGYYYPEALKQIEIILGQNPGKSDTFYALSLKAAVLLSLHKFPEALIVAKEAVALNPYNAQIHGALVDAYVELGDYKAAVEMADKMVSLRPDLRSYARVSYLRELHGDLDGAIEAMEMATKAGYPGYEETAWSRLTLGNIYENYGNLEMAKAQYEQILHERDNYPFAFASLASIKSKEGKETEAIALLKKACSIIPEVSFYEQLAHVYTKLGKTEEAEKTLYLVLEMLEDDEQKGNNMGLAFADVYIHLKDYEKALKYAQDEAKDRPENIEVNQMLAHVYYHMGKYELANIYVEKARITSSINPKLLELMGQILKKVGKEEEGETWIKKAHESNPYLQGHEGN